MITPVRQMLELAGVMEKIQPQDIFIGPVEAVLDYLATQSDDASIQELLRSGANSVRSLLRASLATTPDDRQAALGAIADSLDQEIKQNQK